MKINLLIFILLLSASLSQAIAQNSLELNLIPYRKGEKWGYCNRDKKIVIPCKYDETAPFENGLAQVCLNNKWGLIDKTGKEIVVPTYKNIYKFQKNGLAVVMNDDYKQGIIDKTGKEIVPCKYPEIYSFDSGIAAFLDPSVNLYGYMDETGKVVIKPTFKSVYSIFPKGIGCVKKDEKYIFIDKQGNQLFNQAFDYASYFGEEGLAPVKMGKKYGFIDMNGKLVIPYQYDEVLSFEYGLCSVQKGEKWYIIDKTGKEIFSAKCGFLTILTKNLFSVSITDTEGIIRYGVINKQNKEVLPVIYDVIGGYSEGLFAVKLNNKWGFADTTGRIVIPLQYEDRMMDVGYSNFEALEFQDGIAIMPKGDNEWIFINKTGKPLMNGKLYLQANKFNHGLSYVCIQNYGKCGYIDKNGTEYWED